MVRYFILGNQSILVGLDRHGQIRDFYFPYVGQENHVNGKVHRLGFWVNGAFSWIDAPEWQKALAYKKETMVTEVKAVNSGLGLSLTINDVVSHQKNVFLRKITFLNESKEKKEVRIFFHQLFEISEANVGDTVYFDPLLNALVHYKGKRYFLMNGLVGNHGINQYATGLVGEYGLEGTYKDAEDGLLSNNPIEHGSVDSVAAFHFVLKGGEKKEIFYWVCVGENHKEIVELNEYVLSKKPQNILDESEKYWRKWVNRTKFRFPNLSEKVVDLFKRSLMIIHTHVDKSGAIIASSDSDILFLRKDTYNYMWPRDGALIVRSLDRAGYAEITEHFFKFCNQVLTEEGYLFHKYRPDGSLGSSWHPWIKHGHVQLPIQEDQLALVLDALWKHFVQYGDKKCVQNLFDSFIRKAGAFMLSFIDEKTGLPKESYDLWEERLGIHTFTCATVYAGLLAVANFEEVLGSVAEAKKYRNAAERIKKGILTYLYDEKEKRFIKMIYYDGNELKRDTTVDASSVYGIFEYNVLDGKDERIKNNIQSSLSVLQLKTSVGGLARYFNDSYHRLDVRTPGNPWFITTLWLAEYYIKIAESEKELAPAITILNWVAEHALETGILSEQLHPHTGEVVSVAPLTWSHAAYAIAVNKYLEKLDSLGICKMCNPPKLASLQKKKNIKQKET